jgi:hypothetical protein
MHQKYKIILFFSFLLFTSLQVFPQSFSVSAGGDLVSRYIWRGLNVNDAVNIQPALSLSFGNAAVGVWGSYSLNSNNTTDDNYAFSQEINNVKFIGAVKTRIVFTAACSARKNI